MAKAELHPTDGFGVNGWMVTELHLQGAELLTFALVHQFAQSKAGVYKGNISYLSAWTGWAENTCRKHLVALVQKGLLKEIRGRENNVPFCFYELSEDFYKKHPAKNEGSPLKNCGDTPQNLRSTTPQKLRGDIYNNTISKNEYIPPTPQEVADYCRSRGFKDPEGFADMFLEYCTNSGWRRGNGQGDPITNWKNYIVTAWEARNKFKTFPKREPAVKQIPKDKILDYLQ